MDTTSNALARIIQLLSENQDAQDKVRAELLAANESEEIDYDQLVSLPYLDAICRETLRLYVVFYHLRKMDRLTALPCRYPPVTFLSRE